MEELNMSQNRKFSLQEKIDIFERYFEEGNKEITAKTIFENYPIGHWAIQIRSYLKQKDKRINPTKKQLERLNELGILKKRFDTTIDEKIDAVVEWYKKYPDIIVERTSKDKLKLISEKTIERLKRVAQTEGIEFSELEKRYKKIQSYNEYIIHRKFQGKLREAQIKKCKEGNLRGPFGFPTEIEQLADKLKIDVQQVALIITRYGSFNNFTKMYREGKISNEEVIMYNNNLINNLIDIDYNPMSDNYSNLLCAVFGIQILDENKLLLFQSEKLEENLKALDPREIDVIKQIFGLIDGKPKTLEDLEKQLNITRNNIRHIEVKALRKLRHPIKTVQFRPIEISELKENEYISDEEKAALTDLENDIWNSDLIFKNHSVDNSNFDKDKFDIIRTIKEKINIRKEEAQKTIVPKKEIVQEEAIIPENFENVNITKMNLSVRSYNCLKRIGINTLEELTKLSIEDLFEVRNLGKKSIDEIISKLEEYGIKLAVRNKSKSELEKLRDEKAKLDAEKRDIDARTTQAKQLSEEYDKLIGDDKGPEFKDE